MKHIWLPSTRTWVKVEDGRVKLWDEIQMSPQPIRKDTGFKPPYPPDDPSHRSA